MIVRPPASPAEHEAALLLRWQRLREPWGQPRGSERDDLDTTAYLVVAVDAQGRVIGTGRLHRVDDTTGQIRYMAVATTVERRGIGHAVLLALEAEARRLGAARLRLNARLSVQRFYARHGYVDHGPGPLLYGTIAHRLMKKALAVGD